MSSGAKHLGFALALAATLAMVFDSRPPSEPSAFAASDIRDTYGKHGKPSLQRRFITPVGFTPSVHAGSLVELSNGAVLATWYGGSREGAGDVAVYGATFDSSEGQWSDPFIVTNRRQTQSELARYIRKLGNPVLARDASGRVWLFYVTVSIGGWATSSITYKISEDNGRTWSDARRLVTSPLANLSTLVRGRPLLYADGSMALPTYHEFLGKFAELLRVSSEGRLLDKSRITSGRWAIQPWLVAKENTNVRAFMRRTRSAPKSVLVSHSPKTWGQWGALRTTALPNPDAAVAAALRPDGSVLLAFNDSARDRTNLSLALQRNGDKWQRVTVLDSGAPGEEYSYPYLVRTAAGEYHLIYTWRRQRMAHLIFNDAWVESLQ